MMDLGFKIVRTPYPASSGLTGRVVQKVRDDGRVGPAVGDEALLWDALTDLRSRLDYVTAALEQETWARRDAEKERDEVRALVKGLTERVAAQSELLGQRAEKDAPEPKGRSKR